MGSGIEKQSRVRYGKCSGSGGYPIWSITIGLESRPLITHLGLGDGILQTGAAVVLSERYGKIAVPSYERYAVSTRSFFINYPLISVYTMPEDPSWDWGSPPEAAWIQRIRECGMAQATPLRSGVYQGLLDWDFSATFYRHLDVPYEARFDRCPLLEAWNGVEQLHWRDGSRKIFLHDDPARNFVIRKLVDRSEAFRPEPTDWQTSILRYVGLILEAEEIHVIDSAFFHLVNSFKPEAKLFLHMYPRWPRPSTFRYASRLPWVYVS